MQGRSIEQGYRIDTGREIRFIAHNIRKERTGTHASVIIGIDNENLAWSNFNIERDEDRVRLANSAWKNLDEIDQMAWAQESMRRGLSQFCAGLWNQQIGAIEVGPMAGAKRLDGPPFAIKPYVIEGGGTMVYAPPGRGKSFTAMMMAVSTDEGCDGLFSVEKPRRSLYINIERSRQSMEDRLARVNDCLGLPEERPLHFLNARGKSLNDVVDAAERYVDREGIEIVYLDSVSRAGMGDLNDNQSANRIIDALNGLVPTWVSLAHTPRQDDSHTFGSVHFDAGFDIGVKLSTQMKEEGSAIGVGLTVTKANDAPTGGKPLMYVLEFDETGLCNVRPPRSGEFIELEAGKPRTLGAQVQEYLLMVGEATATTISEVTGLDRANVSRELNAAKWARKRTEGKQVFYSVVYQEG